MGRQAFAEAALEAAAAQTRFMKIGSKTMGAVKAHENNLE